jgi:hypothetical protein
LISVKAPAGRPPLLSWSSSLLALARTSRRWTCLTDQQLNDHKKNFDQTGCMVADRTRVLCVYHRQVGQFLATARVRTLCGRRRPAQKFRICRNKPCTDDLQEYAMHGRVYFPLPPSFLCIRRKRRIHKKVQTGCIPMHA